MDLKLFNEIIESPKLNIVLSDDMNVSDLSNVYNIVVKYGMNYDLCPAEILGQLFVKYNHMAVMDLGHIPYEVIDKIGLSFTNKVPLYFYILQHKQHLTSDEVLREEGIIKKCGFDIVCLTDSGLNKVKRPSFLVGTQSNVFFKNINRLKLYSLDLRNYYIDFCIVTNRDFIKHVGDTVGYKAYFKTLFEEIEDHQKYMKSMSENND